MRLRAPVFVLAVATLLSAACSAASAPPRTTSGDIALANLDHGIGQARDPLERIEGLLERARFLSDHDALAAAVRAAESLPEGAAERMLRARSRAAAHRFDDALADLAQARALGAESGRVAVLEATILVSLGRAAEALPALEAAVSSGPGYASHAALASAYAELGRYRDADREYRAALASLRTSSPFPAAWVHFARGVMWAERAGDIDRGEAEYRLALAHLPQFALARLHLAEIEQVRGDLESAAARVAPLLGDSPDPEALVLQAMLARQRGADGEASAAIVRAQHRYRQLLDQLPLAFADHAAAFYLGPSPNPSQARRWADLNLANRDTARAFALAIRAAMAEGRDPCGLLADAESTFEERALPQAARTEVWAAAGEAATHCALP